MSKNAHRTNTFQKGASHILLLFYILKQQRARGREFKVSHDDVNPLYGDYVDPELTEEDFKVPFCIEVGKSLHLNFINHSHLVKDFMGSHG